MSSTTTRRSFLARTACSGACLLAARAASAETEPKPIDFAPLAYCCATCTPEHCPLRKATLTGDEAFKKQQAQRWQAKYGRSFSPDEVFCNGCKVTAEKQSHAVRTCTVRACVLEKKLVSCAHCRELANCQQNLWVEYPKFREAVLEVQKRVLA